MATLCVATNVEELYTTVLVETPLGAFALRSPSLHISSSAWFSQANLCVPATPAPYFRDCVSAQDLDELNIEIIRNTVRPNLCLFPTPSPS